MIPYKWARSPDDGVWMFDLEDWGFMVGFSFFKHINKNDCMEVIE